MLVHHELNEELRWDNINEFSKEINKKVKFSLKMTMVVLIKINVM